MFKNSEKHFIFPIIQSTKPQIKLSFFFSPPTHISYHFLQKPLISLLIPSTSLFRAKIESSSFIGLRADCPIFSPQRQGRPLYLGHTHPRGPMLEAQSDLARSLGGLGAALPGLPGSMSTPNRALSTLGEGFGEQRSQKMSLHQEEKSFRKRED